MKKVKRTLSLILSLLLVASLSIPTYATGISQPEIPDSIRVGNPIETISEAERIESWLYMRPMGEPVYSPVTSKDSVTTQFNAEKSNGVPRDLAYYIAIQTIKEVGKEDNFNFWVDANLSAPVTVQNLDGVAACYLFQIVYNGKSVGEIAASATIDEAPILYFTYNNFVSSKIKAGQKVYYVEGNGFAEDRNGILFYCGTNYQVNKNMDVVSNKNEDDMDSISKQWTEAVFALKNDSTMLFDVSSTTKSVPSSVNITSVQDYTWYQNCGSTAATMVIDWYGRYKDPQLLLTSRPHSNSVNSRLLTSSYFGSDGPTYSEWVNGLKNYLQNYSSCTVTVSGVDHGNNSTTWTSYKNHIGVTGEPDIVRMRYTSGGELVGHAMAGVGYTGSYYRVRDTWTEDGIITDTYYYNSSSYSFSCILINVATSTWRTSNLQLGSNGVNVRRLETMLYNLYYNPGTINTVFDSSTVAAVKAFQSDMGLSSDGIVGTSTYSALVNAHRFSLQSRVLSIGCSGDDVAELQRRLNRFRQYGGSQYSTIPSVAVDGAFGSGTRSAVITFQQISGLTADGVVGANTYNALLN